MQQLGEIIIKIIKIPFIIIKWIVYASITYLFIFGSGFIIDRYIGWHEAIRPVRDSFVVITIGIIKKTTPHLQKLASQFNEHHNHTTQTTLTKQTQNQQQNTSQDQLPTNQTDQPKQPTTTQPNHTLQTNDLLTQKLTQQLQNIHHKLNQKTKNTSTPFILYTFLSINIILIALIIYTLYSKQQTPQT